MSDFNRVGPFIVGESLGQTEFKLTIINLSKDSKKCAPIEKALKQGGIDMKVVDDKGGEMPCVCRLLSPRPEQLTQGLRPFESASVNLRFANFGYTGLRQAGRYQCHATWATGGKKLEAPRVEFEVADVGADAIVLSHHVALEGRLATLSEAEKPRPVIQQIQLGKRSYLFFRDFHGSKWGGKVSSSFRIAELPGKAVDLKVEGAQGDGNPLTITYRETSYTKWTTTHVINSIDGKPWTAEEEKLRQEKLKREAKPLPDKK